MRIAMFSPLMLSDVSTMSTTWWRRSTREARGDGAGAGLEDLQHACIEAGAQGVGAATTTAVVSSSILILALDYVLTEMFFAQ